MWYAFWDAGKDDDAAFDRRLDAVLREVGDRGKLVLSEAVPPLQEPTPAPAPAPAAALTPAPAASPTARAQAAAPAPTPKAAPEAPTPAPAPAPAALDAWGSSSFSPSMQQLSSPAAAAIKHPRSSADDASLVALLLEQQRLMHDREDKLRHEMEAKMEKMRDELTLRRTPPAEAISEMQLDALQSRLESLHTAQLLSDDELGSLEDVVADFVHLRASVEVVTMELVHTNSVAGKAHMLVSLSEGLPKDAMLARQARRKLA